MVDEVIAGFIGETFSRENFDELLAIHQICQTFPLSKFYAIAIAGSYKVVS